MITYTQDITLIKGFILVFCVGIVTASLQYAPHPPEIVKTIEDVVLNSKAKEGIIIVDIKSVNSEFELVKDKICEGILRNLPSHLITSDNMESLKNTPSKTKNPLIVYVMENGKIEVEIKGIIEKINRIRLDGREKSKILLIITHLEISNPIPVDFISKYAWSQGILDLTIMQVSSTGTVRCNNYNPFNKKNENQEISKDKVTEYFPNKLTDLHGYEITFLVEKCSIDRQRMIPQYCSDEQIEDWHSSHMRIMALADALNIKINIVTLENVYIDDYTVTWEQKAIELHNVVKQYNVQMMVLNGVARYSFESILEYSTPIGMSKYCAVVPIIYKSRLAQSITRLLLVLVTTLLMILAFWLIPKLLKFNRHVWEFMNIIRALLGISWSQSLTRLVERMFYMIMIIGFTRFTFHLYSELVEVIANTQERYKLDNFDDIEASPLGFSIHGLAYDMMYNSSTGSFRKLLKRAIFSDDSTECLSSLVRFKNVSCMVMDKTAIVWKILQGAVVDAEVVITDACVSIVPIMEYLVPQSSYVARFNNILGRLQAAGLFKKWFNEELNVLKSKFERTHFENDDESDATPEVLLVKSLLWLYCLPLLVIILEHLVYRILRLFRGNT